MTHENQSITSVPGLQKIPSPFISQNHLTVVQDLLLQMSTKRHIFLALPKIRYLHREFAISRQYPPSFCGIYTIFTLLHAGLPI